MSLKFYLDKTGKRIYVQSKAIFETDVLGQYVFSFASSAAYTITGQFGAFAFTPKTASLLVARTLSASQGSFTLTPKTVTLKVGHLVTASYGAFAFTAENATLVYAPSGVSYVMNASAGLFAFTAKTAILSTARTVTANYGAFAFTSKTSGLTIARVLIAGYGAFAFTAEDAALTYTSVGPTTYTMDADPGSFTFTGRSADLLFTHTTPAPTPQPRLVGPFGRWYIYRELLDEERRRLEEDARRQAQEKSPVLKPRYEPQREIEGARAMLRTFARNEARPRRQILSPMDFRPAKRVMATQEKKSRDRRDREAVEV